MSDILKFTKHIENLCESHGLQIEEKSEGNFKIFTDSASGITLFLEVHNTSDFSFYFLERTYDIVHHGDRSDVHIIIGLMFASYLRVVDPGISCSLFDIPHAVPDEIWGRYIMPEQNPSSLGITTWKQLGDYLTSVILSVVFWRNLFWELVGCPCEECLERDSIEVNERGYDLPEEMQKIMEEISKPSSSINSGNRIRPNWSFFYNMDKEVTLIKSPGLSQYLELIQKLRKRKIEEIKGINGTLVIDGEIKGFLGKNTINELNRLVRVVKPKSKVNNSELFIIENMIIAVANPYIIAIGRLAGIHKFRIERELLRKRHNREAEILFPIAKFDWQDEICPDQFEGLVKALLEREPDVKTVRRHSPLNQGDKGRDLLIEWNIRDNNIISKTQPPTKLIKVVGQCKASAKTVGKNKVIDIRDTVETHKATGFFLAVSSQISGHMTEKLEQLQLNGIWTQWWNRDDIETRLSKNQDLIPLFPKVVQAKNQVKFVERDS